MLQGGYSTWHENEREQTMLYYDFLFPWRRVKKLLRERGNEKSGEALEENSQTNESRVTITSNQLTLQTSLILLRQIPFNP